MAPKLSARERLLRQVKAELPCARLLGLSYPTEWEKFVDGTHHRGRERSFAKPLIDRWDQRSLRGCENEGGGITWHVGAKSLHLNAI